ncbi:hypothetical protein [Sphingomonas endolithica]|uniref:hypothetical protein n=1 Tax=Sphingomonas endolithica TaxID=2972485 RepID=UPI0021AEAE4B|nr:hypothetical protein [Sphingomonas sp. ZFBP2030]
MLKSLLRRIGNRSPVEIGHLAIKNVRHAIAALGPEARAARAADLAFDRRWGTDTSGGLSTRELGYGDDLAERCRRYDPSSEAMLRAPVSALGLDPAEHAFIDYGAGKGRVLMMAMEMGFRHVVGIELSEHLCEIAKSNIATFVAQHPGMDQAEIVAGDATAYRPSGRSIVAYFYNPFDASIMAEVRTRLEEALGVGAEAVTVIYANPEHDAVFRDAPRWAAGPLLPGISTFRLTT